MLKKIVTGFLCAMVVLKNHLIITKQPYARTKIHGGVMIANHFSGSLAHNIFLSVFVGFLLITTPLAWSGEAGAKKEILVYIDEQVLVAMENGEEVYTFDIVTGREGKETTAGSYKIFKKHEKYTSKKYGSEMPYTMFFSKDGKAIHGTSMATLRSYFYIYITESVGSHGCIGLTDDNAKAMFEWAPVGTPVVVVFNDE